MLFLHWKHCVVGTPPHPSGHLHTGLWADVSQIASCPQRSPNLQGSLQLCSMHALSSEQSVSWSHSPFLTMKIYWIQVLLQLISEYYFFAYTNSIIFRLKIPTWSTLSICILFISWRASTNRLMVVNRACCWVWTWISRNDTRIDTILVSACLIWWTIVIIFASSQRLGFN